MSLLLAILLLTQSCSSFSSSAAPAPATGGNEVEVNPTFVTIDDGAVCLTGAPAAYYFFKGFGNGTRNWLIYLNGGGWCKNITDCEQYIDYKGGAWPLPTPVADSTIMLTNTNEDENPEFYNWNKVSVRYCDASSFTGNSQITITNGTTYYFRGARIFKAITQELLAKGMGNAENALLVDSGYFFPSKRHSRESKFVPIFEGLVDMHGSTPALPKSCTSRLPAALCFFPQNLQGDIRTPIFFLMSAFDTVQINYTLSNEDAVCATKGNCTSSQMKALQELRLELLDVWPNERNKSLKGLLVYSPNSHCLLLGSGWNNLAPGGTKQTIIIVLLVVVLVVVVFHY
ncbi:unnamed protein product [Cuscuta campestris]|uniref:Pectin acetylesterase n=1 Tax=Cuscuta campestris TaxID=132261 RepID=A0A484NJA3_9ASTE|nr:unnamed protein product [Cuscuta campestris]